MVKSYFRVELEKTFGLITSAADIVKLPGGSRGYVATTAQEAILLWNIKTGELVCRFYDEKLPANVTVKKLAYEQSNNLLAAGYSDGSIQLWDVTSATVVIGFNGHKTAISCLMFDSTGTRLFSASADTTIVAWDLVTETGLFRLKGHKNLVTGLALIEDNLLLSTSKDGLMKAWDLETQYCVETHVAHNGECWGVASCKNYIFTASSSEELKLWRYDREQQEGKRIYEHCSFRKKWQYRTTRLTFEYGTLFCSSGRSLECWNMRNDDEIAEAQRKRVKSVHKQAAKRAQKALSKALKASMNPEQAQLEANRVEQEFFENAEKELMMRNYELYLVPAYAEKISSNAILVPWAHGSNFTVAQSNNSIQGYIDGEPNLRIELPGHRSDVRDIDVSGDGKMTVSGSNGMIKVHNVLSGLCLRTIETDGYILCVKFLPGDLLIVAGRKDGVIEIFDLTKSLSVVTTQAHKGAVWSLDLSADGRTLITGGADKSVKFWDIQIRNNDLNLNNRSILEFDEEVLAVKISHDSKFVAASLMDSTIKVYLYESLKFYLNLYGHQLPVLSIDISHDSKLLISSSADKNIKIWGLDFGDCHKSILAHQDSVLQVAFEPQTHYFFSCSKDRTVKYFDADKFVQIQKLEGHQGEVWALAVAPDASFVVSAGHDKSIRVWRFTDDPVFVNEERENELERQHEEDLLIALDRKDDAEEGEDSAAAVTKHSIESLKAGERLYDALEMCIADIENPGQQQHVILATLKISPDQYLLQVFQRIKPSMVEDALLTFPLDRIVKLFTFIRMWVDEGRNIPLVCRILFFCLRTFHKQIIATRVLQSDLNAIKVKLRQQLTDELDIIGRNIAQLEIKEEIWKQENVHTLPSLESDQKDVSVKRLYTDIA